MCLSYINKRITKTEEKEGQGWKVYKLKPKKDGSGYSNTIWQMYFPLPFDQKLVRNKWLRARKTVECGYGDNAYKSGFHIYTEYPRDCSAYDYCCIVQVKYRKGRIIGGQDGLPVVVADEIMILSNPRKRKK